MKPYNNKNSELLEIIIELVGSILSALLFVFTVELNYPFARIIIGKIII